MRALSTARLAGMLYLVVVLAGLFSLAYVPSRIAVPGDDAATFANILAMEPLFRAGIAAGIVCYLAFLLLPLALYRLLEPAGPTAARLMTIFALVSVPMALLNLARRLDALAALHDGQTVEAARMLTAYGSGLTMVQLFWGLWLFPLGWLLLRSAVIPRVFGGLLILGGLGYLIRIFGGILAPEALTSPFVRYISIPGSIGEIGTCLWLLIAGARPVKTSTQAQHG